MYSNITFAFAFAFLLLLLLSFFLNSYPQISLPDACSDNENFMSRKIRALACSNVWTIFSFLPLNVSSLTVVPGDTRRVITPETRLSILMDTDLPPRLRIPRVVLLSKFCWKYLLKMCDAFVVYENLKPKTYKPNG
jgi:hypothetical protein